MVFTAPSPFVRNWKFPHILSFLGVISLGFSSSLEADRLPNALAQLYQTSASLAAAQANLKAIDELAAQARAAWLPQASFVSSVDQEARHSTVGSDVPGTPQSVHRTGTSNNLEILQNVYQAGATEANDQMKRAEIQAMTAQYQATEQKIILEAIKIYLNVLETQRALELALKNEKALKTQLEQGKARFELGDLTLTDISQIEARFSRATADRIAAENALESAQSDYIAAFGEFPTHLSFAHPPQFLPKTKAEALEISLQKNPDFLKTQYDEIASKENITIVKSGILPSVDLKFNLSRDSNTDSWNASGRTYDAKAMASLKVPLDITGGGQSKVREARQKASSARLAKIATRSTIEADTAKKMDALDAAEAQIKRYKEEVKATETAQKGMALEEELGTRTMTDRLNAEAEHYTAQVELLKAQIKALVAHYELLATLGELTPGRLELPTTGYNPQLHQAEVDSDVFSTSINESPILLEEQKIGKSVDEALEEVP